MSEGRKTLDDLEQQVIEVGATISRLFRVPRTENAVSLSTKLDVILVQLESIREEARILEDEITG